MLRSVEHEIAQNFTTNIFTSFYQTAQATNGWTSSEYDLPFL